MQIFVKRHYFGLLFLFFLVLTGLAYYPGLYGPPVLDDYAHLSKFTGDNFSWPALKDQIFVTSLGESARPLSMLSFAINAYPFHKSLFSLKVMNLLIHLLNGFLLYQLAKVVLLNTQKSDPKLLEWMAFFSGILWVAHPLLVSTVLYAIQRMTLMASMFSLLGLLWYVRIRPQYEKMSLNKQLGSLFILHLFGLCAVLSKESGVLMYGYLFILELTLFPSQGERPSAIGWLQWLAIGLPIFSILAYFFYGLQDYLLFYLARNFTLPERLMTESHILFHYLGEILCPSLKYMGMYRDDMPIVHHLDLITGLLLLFWCVFAILPLFIFRKRPILAFCLLWFAVSHILESTILPLELDFAHRNYLAVFSISLAFVYYVTRFLRHYLRPKLIKFFFIVCFTILWFNTLTLAKIWSDEMTSFLFFVEIDPDSYRANSAFIEILNSQNEYQLALERTQHLIEIRPHEPSAYMERIRIEGCFMKQAIPQWQWQALFDAGHTMKDPSHMRLYIQKFIFSIRDGACKGLNLKPLITFLRVIEQNKAFSGFPLVFYRTSMAELYNYIAYLAELVEDDAVVSVYYREMFALSPSNYTPLVRLFDYQVQHHALSEANNTLEIIIKAYKIESHNSTLPAWLTLREQRLETAKKSLRIKR